MWLVSNLGRQHSMLNSLRGNEHVWPRGSAKTVIKLDDRIFPEWHGRRPLGPFSKSEVDVAATAAIRPPASEWQLHDLQQSLTPVD